MIKRTARPPDILDEYDDDGTMPDNVAHLASTVVGHRIVTAEVSQYNLYKENVLRLTLDNGTTVNLMNTDDCCAYTDLEAFLLHPELVDHIITGVDTEDGYTRWHIYCDWGDILDLTVAWSAGNPFYYGYGFSIIVEQV